MEASGLLEWLRSLWLIWLILLFALVVWWAYRPKNKKRFEEDAQIPFRDEGGGKEDGR
jgi:cytochrome c oxidase cbb3-type subunit 4